jgi:hypothetical protein
VKEHLLLLMTKHVGMKIMLKVNYSKHKHFIERIVLLDFIHRLVSQKIEE